MFRLQEKLTFCLESKIRWTISVAFYINENEVVTVITLMNQFEIQEQELLTGTGKWKIWAVKTFGKQYWRLIYLEINC